MKEDQKRCACSPTCSRFLPLDHAWKYAYGHSPANAESAKIKRGTPLQRTPRNKEVYLAALTQLRVDLTVITAECDRLDDQADAARATMTAALAAKDKAAERHELLTAMIGGFEELLEVAP